MKKWLGVLVGMVAFLASSQSYGDDICTMPAAIFNWTAVNTISAGVITCVGGGTVAGSNDVYVFPDGAIATVTGDITFTSDADDEGIIIEDGATFIWDQTDDEAIITLFEGTTAPDATTDVAFYAEPSSILRINGGFRQWGVANPSAQEDHLISNSTTWPVDLIGVCSPYPRSLGNNGAGAGDGDCDSEEEQICFVYSIARNDPEDGLTGQNYLEEAIGELTTDDRIRFTSGGDKGWSYDVVSVDTSDPFGFCIDVTRMYDAASAEFPVATRENISGQVHDDDGYIPKKGDTCIETLEDTVITADGDYVGRCIRLCDTGNGDCDTRPYRITKTLEDTECDGSTGVDGDSIYISDLAPLANDHDEEAYYSIDYCISQGDEFTIETPALLVDGTPADDIDGKVIIKSTDVTLKTAVIAGAATVKFENAGFTDVGYLDIIDTGDAGLGLPGVEFENMVNVDIQWFTQSGGDGTGGNAHHMVADGVTGTFRLRNAGFRYNGDASFLVSGIDNGWLEMDEIKFEFATGSAIVIETGTTGYFAHMSNNRNLFCFDCISVGNAADFVWGPNPATVNIPFEIDGLLALSTGGGIARGNALTSGVGVVLKNFLWLDAISGRGTPSNIVLPDRISYCDIRGHTAPDNPLWEGSANVDIDSYFENCSIVDMTTADDGILNAANGGDIKNVSIYNPITSDACGAACAAVKFNSHATRESVVRNVTVAWPDGITSSWDSGVNIIGDAGSAFSFGGILVSGLDTNEATGIDGILVGTAALLTDHTTFYDNFCVDRSFNIGGAFTSINPIASFPATWRMGYVPRFDDETRGMASLFKDGYVEYLGCGAKTGANRPGLQENRWGPMAEAMMTDKPYRVHSGTNAYGSP